MKITRKRFTCWITKATNTYSEYVLLFDFSRQRWLRQRASISRYTCIASVVLNFYTSLFFIKVRFLSFRQIYLARSTNEPTYSRFRHWTKFTSHFPQIISVINSFLRPDEQTLIFKAVVEKIQMHAGNLNVFFF